MQAVVAREWGEPEVLVAEQLDDPRPPAGHVLVELRASSVNWHDVLVRRLGRGLPLPRVLGMDGAGVRRDTGEEVVLYPGLGWGPGEAAPAPGYELLGDATSGTYAELVSVPEANLAAKPRGWSFAEAAALPTAGITAHRALFARGCLRAGETVLVLGASGGVSTLAISLAAAAGARVVVTSAEADKLERARELGATDTVDRSHGDWAAQVRELTGGGVDVAVDGVGADLAAAVGCLRAGGRIVVFGASGGAVAELDLPRFYFSHASILASSLGSPRDFRALLAGLDGAAWRPVIDTVRPLGEAAEAHRRMEAREHFGKLVLAPSV